MRSEPNSLKDSAGVTLHRRKSPARIGRKPYHGKDAPALDYVRTVKLEGN